MTGRRTARISFVECTNQSSILEMLYSCIVDYDLDAASSVATTGNKLKNGVN